MKIEPNVAVVFKKHSEFNGAKFNAVLQQEDGTVVFFDTDTMHTSGELMIATTVYMEGDL